MKYLFCSFLNNLCYRLFGCLLFFFASFASAAVLNVETEFKADISSPGKNTFKNTTPKSGFCTIYPDRCGTEEFSIIVPGLSAIKAFEKASSDIKKHTYLSIDGRKRPVVLINKKNGFSTVAEFRWAFFGVQHNRTDGQQDIVSAMLSTGASPTGDCTGKIGSGIDAWYRHGWGVNNKLSVCYRRLNNDSSDGEVTVNNFSVGYVLETPKPLELPTGEYEGEVVYTVGEGMDVDFGAKSYSDNEVRIKIKAIVEHSFFYLFPAGSENVQLSPPNGWSSWINGGQVPDKLTKEVPFTLSSSSGFKVWMECEHNSGTGCGLKNQATAETVPLDVKFTIPGFTSNRQPVRNMLLNTDVAGHIIDPPGQFAVDLRSKLDFVVNRPEVEKMVKAPGSNWKGAVTLIFDSEVE